VGWPFPRPCRAARYATGMASGRALLPVLVPSGAAAIVLGFAFAVVQSQDGGSGRMAAVPPATAAATATQAQPEDPPTARQPGSVCQSFGDRPEPGEAPVFAPEYTQQRTVLGLTIVGNKDVDTRAFAIAEETIERMFAENDLVGRLVEAGAYVVIAAARQEIADLPEFRCLDEATAARYSSACAVADLADYPLATVSELDLLGSRRGPCRGLNILFHELGHLVHAWSMPLADYYDARLLYQDAVDSGAYGRGAYALTNFLEYFAEGTQSYFLAVRANGARDRAWLQENDPELFAILGALYSP